MGRLELETDDEFLPPVDGTLEVVAGEVAEFVIFGHDNLKVAVLLVLGVHESAVADHYLPGVALQVVIVVVLLLVELEDNEVVDRVEDPLFVIDGDDVEGVLNGLLGLVDLAL